MSTIAEMTEAQRFGAFVTELTKISRQYCFYIKTVAGVHEADPADIKDLEYFTCNTGDLTPLSKFTGYSDEEIKKFCRNLTQLV